MACTNCSSGCFADDARSPGQKEEAVSRQSLKPSPPLAERREPASRVVVNNGVDALSGTSVRVVRWSCNIDNGDLDRLNVDIGLVADRQ